MRFEISNKISDEPVNDWISSRPPDWKPLSPGMRLCLLKLKLMHYRKLLADAPCSMRWLLSTNGSDPIERETKFADIPLIDLRHK